MGRAFCHLGRQLGLLAKTLNAAICIAWASSQHGSWVTREKYPKRDSGAGTYCSVGSIFKSHSSLSPHTIGWGSHKGSTRSMKKEIYSISSWMNDKVTVKKRACKDGRYHYSHLCKIQSSIMQLTITWFPTFKNVNIRKKFILLLINMLIIFHWRHIKWEASQSMLQNFRKLRKLRHQLP